MTLNEIFSKSSKTNKRKIDKIPFIDGRKEKSLERFTTSPDGAFIAFIGNDGYIILLEAKTKMWIANFKMNGSARAVSFTPDGRYLVSSGSDGEVYRYVLCDGANECFWDLF